jgi:ATP synthase protein I
MSGNDAHRERETGSRTTAEGDLSARLRQLETQLDRKRQSADGPAAGSRRSAANSTMMGRAFRMSTEFIAGILAGGGLGWLFDRVVGTSPWGLIVFLMLGFAAGIVNLLRAAKSLDSASDAGSNPQASKSLDSASDAGSSPQDP